MRARQRRRGIRHRSAIVPVVDMRELLPGKDILVVVHVDTVDQAGDFRCDDRIMRGDVSVVGLDRVAAVGESPVGDHRKEAQTAMPPAI